MNRLKLREIEAFIAVVEERGIVKAAERLFCVPSNISKLINDLEERCQEKLFNRTQRQLQLTPYGRYFYDQARLFIQEANLFSERLFTQQNAKLLIGGIDIALDHYLPEPLTRYKTLYPDVGFEVFRGYSNALIQGLYAHDYDLIFSDGPIEFPNLKSLFTFQSELICVGKNAQESTEQIIFSYGKQCSYRAYIELWAKENLQSFKIVEIESYPIILQLIKQQCGISFIPHSIVETTPRFRALARPDTRIKTDIYLAWNRLNHSLQIENFINYFKEYVTPVKSVGS